MLCCCCVPLGMAIHIIAFFDIIVAIFLIIQGAEFNNKKPDPKDPEIYSQFYKMISGMCFASMAGVSIPRAVMYFLTLGKFKSFARMQWYFRTRIVTFLILFLILAGCFLFCFFKADDLIKANPDLNRTLILVIFGVFALVWLIIDISWSTSLRTYAESKKDTTEQLLNAKEKVTSMNS